jgi:hypothetical protein
VPFGRYQNDTPRTDCNAVTGIASELSVFQFSAPHMASVSPVSHGPRLRHYPENKRQTSPPATLHWSRTWRFLVRPILAAAGSTPSVCYYFDTAGIGCLNIQAIRLMWSKRDETVANDLRRCIVFEPCSRTSEQGQRFHLAWGNPPG